MSRLLSSVLAAQGLQTTVATLALQNCEFWDETCIGDSFPPQREFINAIHSHSRQIMVNWGRLQQQQQQQRQLQQQDHNHIILSYGCSTDALSPQQHCFQQQPALGLLRLHRQAALMQGLPALLQPWGQQTPSKPIRSFTSSTALAAAKKHLWVQPVPHQPAKHVPGTDPLKVVKAASSVETLSSIRSKTPAATEAAIVQHSQPGLGSRMRAALAWQWQSVQQAVGTFWAGVEGLPWRKLSTAGVWCTMTASAVTSLYLVLTNAMLKGTPGNLRSNDPQLQELAVLRLHSVIGLLPLGWDDIAQQIVDCGLLNELAALIKPGIDAVVLNAICKLLDKLLDEGGSMGRDMMKAGIADALTNGLQEGWLPKGAAEAATAVHQRLAPPAAPVQPQ